MAKVILRAGWFAPNGVLYRKSAARTGPPVDIPDYIVFDNEGKSRLPTSAKLVDDDYVTPEPQRVSADTFSEHQKMLSANDPRRAAMESQGAAMVEADQTLADNRARHQAELAAEKMLDVKEEKPKKGKKGNK